MNTILAYIFGGIILFIIIYLTYPVWRIFKRFLARSALGLIVISSLSYLGFGLVGTNILTLLFCGIFGIPGIIFLEIIAKIM